MLGSRTRIPSCVPFRLAAMDLLPLLFADVNRSVSAANDDAGTLAQPIDLSCSAVVRGSDALPVVSPTDIEMVCVGTATGVDHCSRGLVISLCVGGNDLGAGRCREDCRLPSGRGTRPP
jgi:hypothetical protein